MSPARRQRRRVKDTAKLYGRLAEDFAAFRTEQLNRSEADAARAGGSADPALAAATTATLRSSPPPRPADANPALLRLRALAERDGPVVAGRRAAPVASGKPSWTPLGPLAVPNGQTYGGNRILISGRVTAIAAHPTDPARLWIGTSRGGVWRTDDGAVTWRPLTDDQPSLAIGALGAGTSDPDVLYAGTGEGNVQLYSTVYAHSSAPGVYLGVGVLRSSDGGATWSSHAAPLLAGASFYRIAVDRNDADRAFGATSRGLVRTTDGANWALLTGGGLPPLSADVIACCDVVIDRADPSGNTVYAAFWGSGVYRSTDALSTRPTFTLLDGGLPAGPAISRISLSQSPSNPSFVYALIADAADGLNGLYRSTAPDASAWELCTKSTRIQVYGAFTNDVNVDPATPDVVYVSGVELYRCVRNSRGVWGVTNVGGAIHPDNHALAFHPTLNQVLYAGNDGGFFVSRDAGATWDDSPNEGLCLLQYEVIDTHPATDGFVQGGTQDNGTQQYRNSPVHHHSADGDGGSCTVSKVNGANVTHSYYGNAVERSTTGGAFGSYADVSAGLDGDGVFYPPSAISPTSERMAWGTTVVNIDAAMGAGGWPGSGVALPGLVGRISALSFASDSLLWCATTSGQVYQLTRSGSAWRVRALHGPPLPTGQWIWDVSGVPGDDGAVVVAFSGFGLADHVWQGEVPATGDVAWTPVSTGLPDVPMYALCLASPDDWYVGTDIGVWRSADGGQQWEPWSQGLPNTAVYDLRLRAGSTMLRAATHGRGLWEMDTGAGASTAEVDVFVRNHAMDPGRGAAPGPEAAAWDDPTRHITLGSPCWWWECADVKVDAPPTFQLSPATANYYTFETGLVHEDPEVGTQNQVYVQVHNRGPKASGPVTVLALVAPAAAGPPDLPADFWAAWPHSAGDANWEPLGPPRVIPALDPLRPEVVSWPYTPAVGSDPHSCVLVVVEPADDPLPAATRATFAVAPLVATDKRIGLHNLHLVTLGPDDVAPRPVRLHASADAAGDGPWSLRLPRFAGNGLSVRYVLSTATSTRVGARLPAGLTARKVTAAERARMRAGWLGSQLRPESSWVAFQERFDVTRSFSVSSRGSASWGVDLPLDLTAGGDPDEIAVVALAGGGGVAEEARLSVVQRAADGEVAGGTTFVFTPSEVG
ncbi:MAG: hypothetical protein R2761_06875 [Acidimicrobiales bacterium]